MSNEPTEMSASPETRTKAAEELPDRLAAYDVLLVVRKGKA